MFSLEEGSAPVRTPTCKKDGAVLAEVTLYCVKIPPSLPSSSYYVIGREWQPGFQKDSFLQPAGLFFFFLTMILEVDQTSHILLNGSALVGFGEGWKE